MQVTGPCPDHPKAIPSTVSPTGWTEYWKRLAANQRRTLSWFLVSLTILTLAFIKPLAQLTVYAWGASLHSHILLIPFISVYLLRLRLGQLPTVHRSSPGWAILSTSAGAAALVAVWMLRTNAPPLSLNDHLALMSLSYVCLLMALGFLFLGRHWMGAAAFPVCFLIFMVPLPDALVEWLEVASQYGSAETAHWFFQLAGVPVLRNGTVFHLPGIDLQVASECSGIRSSWVLFITSLVAADLFLRTTWRRAMLVLLIIPLGLLRNGFRIMVIGWLCVEFGPETINSIIHRRGGPLFFALALIPLFLLLWWLRRGETPEGAP